MVTYKYVIKKCIAESRESPLKKINADYIKKAALDIANFVYNLELKINSTYPKSNYPRIYPPKTGWLAIE